MLSNALGLQATGLRHVYDDISRKTAAAIQKYGENNLCVDSSESNCVGPGEGKALETNKQ